VPTALLIHAHPDDEVFANFGWAHRLAAQGYEIVGVIATGGEASELHAASSLSQARSRRLAKYERALDILGARSWTWLDPSAGWIDAPGGPAISNAAAARLQSAVERLFVRYRPDIVLTVGTDSLTGHPDHLAVARAVSGAAVVMKCPGGVWGARFKAADVRAANALVASHAQGRKVGSGRVAGTTAELTARDVRSSAAGRRAALDVYRDGLGTDPLCSVARASDRIGDSVLLRGLFEATSWRHEYYEALSSAYSVTDAGRPDTTDRAAEAGDD